MGDTLVFNKKFKITAYILGVVDKITDNGLSYTYIILYRLSFYQILAEW